MHVLKNHNKMDWDYLSKREFDFFFNIIGKILYHLKFQMSIDLFGRFENSRLDWNKASVRFLTYRFWLGGILRLKSQKVAAKITIRKFFGITQHMCWIILLPEQTIGKTFPVTLSDNVATWNFRRWRFDNLKGSRRVSSFSIDENEMEELIICAPKRHTLHIFHKSFF